MVTQASACVLRLIGEARAVYTHSSHADAGCAVCCSETRERFVRARDEMLTRFATGVNFRAGAYSEKLWPFSRSGRRLSLAAFQRYRPKQAGTEACRYIRGYDVIEPR